MSEGYDIPRVRCFYIAPPIKEINKAVGYKARHLSTSRLNDSLLIQITRAIHYSITRLVSLSFLIKDVDVGTARGYPLYDYTVRFTFVFSPCVNNSGITGVLFSSWI